MASSSTLAIFVPPVGTTVVQDTASGSKVSTTQFVDTTRSRIFPGDLGNIVTDTGIKEATSGNTSTTFSGRTNDTSYVGNDDTNSVNFTGTARNLTADLGKGNDSFRSTDIIDSSISLGDGNDTSVTRYTTDTTITTGAGNDSVTILKSANSVSIDTGTGDDTLIFGGKVTNSEVLLGQGADQATFSGPITNTTINLGGDTDLDTVTVNSKSDLGTGTVITGAGEGDLLIIGGEEYVFDNSKQAFISGSNDSISFG